MTSKTLISAWDTAPLHCPWCLQMLSVSQDRSALICSLHGEFLEQNGIPMFVDDPLFNGHWRQNHLEQISPLKLDEARRFLQPVYKNWRGAGSYCNVLDAGCGDGVHALVINEWKQAGLASSYTGVDISLEAVRIASSRCNDKTSRFITADVAQTPFSDGAFDVVFSFGVLAYTKNPSVSFAELCRVTRSGGLIGVWMYPKKTGFAGKLFEGIRNLCKAGGPVLTRMIADGIVPLLFFLPTASRMNLLNASWKQCREVVLVNIQPQQLYFPTKQEILDWFERNGIEVVSIDDSRPITVWGQKQSRTQQHD